MAWYPQLQEASLKQLSEYRFICHDTGIEWPQLDDHLSIESSLLGSTEQEVA